MMDRDDISDLAIIFGSYFIMILLGAAFQGQPTLLLFSQSGVLVFAFAALIIKGEAMKYFAAAYTHLYCVVKPKQEHIEFFVRREGQKIETDPDNPDHHAITLPLGTGANVDPFGKVHKIAIDYTGDWSDRVITAHTRNAHYKGEKIEHDNSALLVLKLCEKAPVTLEKDKPIPIFSLVYAPGDEDIDKGALLRNLGFKTPEDLPNIVTELVNDNEQLRSALSEKKREADGLHNLAIQQEEIIDNKTNELEAVHSQAPKFKESVARYCQTRFQGWQDVMQLGKITTWYNKLGWWIIIPVMYLFTLIAIGLNPELLSPLGNTQMQIFIITILVVIVAGIYYLFRRRR